MSWTTAVNDLRALLSDQGTDRLRWRKKCLGFANGTNLVFKTFEKRRVTGSLLVYVNDVLATTTAMADDTGEFTLQTAPAEGARIEASYYVQWWTDTQLQGFLTNGTRFLGLGTDYTQVPDGFINAVLKYAAADAYQELSVRYAEMVSEQYRMEDMPKDALKVTIEGFQKSAAQYRKEATDLRNDFYTRQGETNAPTWDSISGDAHNVEPNA